MMRPQFPAGITARLSRRRRARSLRQFHPAVLGLEDRVVLSTIYVVPLSTTTSSGSLPTQTADPTAPTFDDIQQAIDYAATTDDGSGNKDTIKVESGSYSDSSLTIPDGGTTSGGTHFTYTLQILGGYGSSFSDTDETRSPRSSSFTPTTTGSSNTYDVQADNADTTIDGFTFAFDGSMAGTGGTRQSGGILAEANGVTLNNSLVEIGVSNGSPRSVGLQTAGGTSGLTATNNTFSAAPGETATFGTAAEGIFLNSAVGGTLTTISGNTFTGPDLASGLVDKSGAPLRIAANSFTRPSGTPDYYFPLIDLRSNALDPSPGVTISANTINGGNASDASGTNYGIWVGYDNTSIPISNVTISNNTITGNGVGVLVSPMASNITVTGNSIAGNSVAGLSNTAGSVVDASANWWGSSTGPKTADNPNGTGDVINDGESSNSPSYVDYTPWLDSGTDINPNTPGYQPDFSQLTVTSGGAQVHTTGRVQEAVDDSDPNGFITVLAGTYTEQVSIAKSLIILGRSATVEDPDSGSASAVVTITGGANVQLAGLSISGTTPSDEMTSDDGILINDGSTGYIHDSQINGYQGDGIDVTGSGSSAKVALEIIRPGTGGQAGLSVSGGATATATTSIISGTVSLAAAGSDGLVALTAHDVDLSGSTGTSVVTTTDGTIVDASDDYWGTVDPAAVMTKANGGTDVDYSPYQAAPFYDATASAPDNSTLYVVDDTTQVGTKGRVQEGINDATTGGTVYVEPGTYTEQLTIAKSLTVTGVADSNGNLPTILAPTTLAADSSGSRNVVTITGASTVTGASTLVNFGDLIVDGGVRPGDDTIDTGIFVRDGANATIHDDTVTRITQTPMSPDLNGVGIQVGKAAFNTIGTATIINVAVTQYQRNGITVDGAGSTGTITNATVTGAGPTNVAAQNGIQISRGATGSITDGSVTGNDYTGDPGNGTSSGILLYQAGSDVMVNGVFLNGNYIGIRSSGATGTMAIQGNLVLGFTYGILSDSSGSASTTTIDNNTVNGGGVANTYGILASGLGTTSITNSTLFANYVAVDTNFTDHATTTHIDGNTIDNTNSVAGSYGILGTAAGTTTVDGNTIRKAAYSIYTASADSAGMTDVSNNHILGDGTVNTYGIVSISTGTSTLGGDFVDATDVAIDSDSAGSTMITNNTLGSTTPNLSAGVEVDRGVVSVSGTTIAGNGTGDGIDAAGSDGNATVNLTSTRISGEDVGILVDSTQSDANGPYSTTVNVNDTATTVTAVPAGGHGALLAGTMSTLKLTANPMLTQADVASSYSSNADGTYNVTYTLNGSDNITSPNDLAYSYELDGAMSSTSVTGNSFTLSNLSGTHSIVLQVTNQGGLSATQSETIYDPMMLGDGGFETPALGQGNFQYKPSGSPWTFSGTSGNSGISANGSAFTGGNPNAPQGSQVAILQQNGFFSQTFTASAGGMYVLNLEAAQRAGYNQPGEDFEVDLVDTTTGTPTNVFAQPQQFTPSGTAYQALSTANFAIKQGDSYTLTFRGLDTSGGDHTAFIDAIALAVASTPPPAAPTTALVNGGFETPALGQGNFQYKPSGATWVFGGTNGNSGISANGSAFTGGNPGAPQGGQVAILQQDGFFSQTFTAASDAGTGTSYVLNFQDAQRGDNGTSAESFEVDVVDTTGGTSTSVLSQQFTPGGTGYQQDSTNSFTLISGHTYTVYFRGVDPSGADYTAFIDAVALAVAPPPAAPTTALVNGGFETPALGQGNFQYRPLGATWAFGGTNGNSGISANGSAFTGGNPGAPQGGQVAILQQDGFFSQTFTAASDASSGTFNLSFQDAQRGDNGTSVESFTVELDDTTTSTSMPVFSQAFTPAGTSYQQDSINGFTLVAGHTYTLSFLGAAPAGDDYTAFIDNVAIAKAS